MKANTQGENAQSISSSGLDTLLGLLHHFSPTGREQEAVAWMVERLRRLGFQNASIDGAGNAVGVMGEGPRQVVLLGHIDTVPGEIEVHWEGEALHGRGAVDAKGPLAALIDAVAQLGAIPGWQWIVIGAVDEEGDSRGARYLLDRFRPECVIVGEPSRWDRVTLGYKGSSWTSVTVRRPLAHSARPQPTACEAALAYWDRVRTRAAELNEMKTRVFDQVSPSLRGMSSGDDGFEAWARLEIGTRLPPGLAPEAWRAELERADPSAEVEASGFASPAYLGEKNSALTRAFVRSIRERGGQPTFVLKSGTADLNLVGPAWGCPAVAYGPGDSSLDHTPNEHILIAEYGKAVAVLRGTLEELTRLPEPGHL
ncbi:MAG: [LysW]-lysine hydrolase [Anaerolineales bacterium]